MYLTLVQSTKIDDILLQPYVGTQSKYNKVIQGKKDHRGPNTAALIQVLIAMPIVHKIVSTPLHR